MSKIYYIVHIPENAVCVCVIKMINDVNAKRTNEQSKFKFYVNYIKYI